MESKLCDLHLDSFRRNFACFVFISANTHMLHGTEGGYSKLRLIYFGVTKYVTRSEGQEVKRERVRK
jgi:hypothetical protein